MKYNCSYTKLTDVHKLVENPKNPNKHPDRQIELLAKIIDYQGQRNPIVVSKRSGYIVKGHGRLEAVKKLGWKRVAIDEQDYENEAQEYADMIADNKIAELAEHDDLMMIDEIKELEIEDLELLGLDDFELPTEPDPAKEEIEDEVPTNVETRCKEGDLWILGEHRLLCGDATNVQHVEKLMGGEKADMVFTDPPYGVNYTSRVDKNKRKPWGEIKNDNLKNEDLWDFLRESVGYLDCNKYICCNWQSYIDFEIALGKPNSLIVWDKESIGLGAGHRNQHEFILFFGKLDHNSESNVWKQKRESTSTYKHPTQKPVEIPERGIKNFKSKKVLDLFGGSGSTLIACEKTNRKCYMMEIDPHYCDVILSRWEKYSGKKSKLSAV